VTAVYLLFGSLWIYLTDWALLALVDDPAGLTRIQTWKGWVYVGGSGVLVYWLTRGALASVARMKRSGRRVETVLDTIPSRVAWRDGSGRFLGCNRGFADDAGLDSPAEIRGLTDVDLAWAVTTPEIRADTARALQTGEASVGQEALTASRAGEMMQVRYSVAALVDEDDRIEGSLLCYDDVTGQVTAREQLRQAQKMNEIGQFTTGVAHDFNNVLSVIRANSELVAEGVLDGDESRQAVGEIAAAARGAGQMVNRLLSLARRADVKRSPTDVAELIGSLSSVFSRILTPSYSYRLDVVGHPPLAMVDPMAVEQALLNLITNARDAMPDGGRIHVEISEVERAAEPGRMPVPTNGAAGFWTPPSPTPPLPGRYVAISVSDEGSGIDPSTRSSIFQPFFTTKERGAGTGLGLAMVLGLMEQQGGGVDVRSGPGEGTTMRLLLPVVENGAARPDGSHPDVEARGAAAGRVPAAADQAGGGEEEWSRIGVGSAPILVVDDQPDLRRTIGRVLRRYGWQVVEAEDGSEALELADAQGWNFSLILSDLTMPGMGGLELYREIRARGVPVPFAVTSGLAELRDVAGSEEEAELPFIPKPWTPQELMECIREWTRS